MRSHGARLHVLDELAVAVVDEEDERRVAALQPVCETSDLRHGDRRPPRVAARALHVDDACRGRDRSLDRLQVKHAAWQQLHLRVPHAEVRQRASQQVVRAAPQPDDFLQGVVRRAAHAEELLPGPKHPKESAGDGVRAREELHAHKRGLCAHQVGIDRVEDLAAEVAMAIPVDPCEVVCAHGVAAESREHLAQLDFRPPVDGCERRLERGDGPVDRSIGAHAGGWCTA
mmetsp:Transcript_4257/g.10559  ORF Transcript_4257/g.10559 Transcript_4257/m.10559 type:complete len:229 (+) Transcript_4257:1052-1738(+)